ncbi:hypothetical protein VKT23_012503 [Stygiomarasmius scandens]|uniref:Uncharacterized protein n=1 Tax=Marasmiellus scandens TaxID=2682957 RepID=A0ABR1J619_9AGAR
MRLLSVQVIVAVFFAATAVKAAPLEVTRTLVIGTRTIVLPGPSPSCRNINDPAEIKRAAEIVGGPEPIICPL